MKVVQTGLLSRVLGPDWSFRAEHAASLEIAARLKQDRIGRIAVLFATASLSSVVVPLIYVISWVAVITFNELTEPFIPRRNLRNDEFGPAALTLTLLHRFYGAVSWVAAGVIWMVYDPHYALLGFGILVGILIHISYLYNNSRLQTAVTAMPALTGFAIVLFSICLDPGRPVFDKLVFGFAVLAVLAYLTFAALHNLRIREQLRNLFNETRRLAGEDPLTGLMNRRAFVDVISGRIEQAQATTLAFVDLDRFKPLNDEHGHAVGDEVLNEIGRRLSTHPGLLAAARLGGDEFAVLISDQVGHEDAAVQISELHASVTSPISSIAGPVSVGASIGWVTARPGSATVSEILYSADVAMRRAKTGRGGVVAFDPSTDNTALVSSAMEIAFQNTLASGRIRAALQPIVSVQSNQILSMELLARWPASGFPRDPEPQEFIPIAERLGLLNELLWSTLEQALPYVAGNKWSLAINVSPSQLTSGAFLEKLLAAVAKHGVDARQIELEVTEQVALRNLADNCAVLDQARSLGFRIVLDDFGVGNSSLTMLSRLPLDKIKLDRAFVAELRTVARSQKVLRATAALAKDLGIVCAVAGVECAKTAELAAELGCDQIQGYWVGRPKLVPERIHADRRAG